MAPVWAYENGLDAWRSPLAGRTDRGGLRHGANQRPSGFVAGSIGDGDASARGGPDPAVIASPDAPSVAGTKSYACRRVTQVLGRTWHADGGRRAQLRLSRR